MPFGAAALNYFKRWLGFRAPELPVAVATAFSRQLRRGRPSLTATTASV